MARRNIDRYKQKIVPVLKRNGVVRAGIFGSIARGDEKRGSDVDILVKFRGDKSLLDVVGMEKELKKKIGRRVDLITYRSLNPLLKDKILREEIRII